MNRILLCRQYIENLRNKGEKIFQGKLIYDYEISKESDMSCERCDKYEELYECIW